MQTEFGLLIKQLRANRGLTQEALARRIGTSQTHIYRIESGDITRPSGSIVGRLAQALDTDTIGLLKAIDGGPSGMVDTPDDLIMKLQHSMPVQIPVIGNIHAPTAPDTEVEFIYWPREKAAGKDLVGVRVRGYCLEPDIMDGDVIILDRDAVPDVGKVLLCFGNRRDNLRLIRYYASNDITKYHVYGVVVGVSREL